MSRAPEPDQLGAYEEFAPAKVNLYLHVGPVGGDGYHAIHSLMMFADIGDALRMGPSSKMGLAQIGPFATSLEGGPDNLVVRARDLLLAKAPIGMRAATTFRLTLEKMLPIASGLGGGSSDAAATLRLLRRALNLDIGDEHLTALALRLGSDVPACLAAEPSIASGRGERLAAPPPMPDLAIVLANPKVPSPTGVVYRAYDMAPHARGADAPVWPAALTCPEQAADFLASCRNDLEAPAVRLEPAIGAALALLAAQPESLLTRMSGSGATCFALCVDRQSADRSAARLGSARPDWWVRAGTLRGARSQT